MKHLRISFSNGAVWGIPLDTIARDRSNYYAKKDPDTTFEQEFDFVMSDDYEGLDWFQNNMNWKDVALHAYEITPPNKFDPGEMLHDDGTSLRVILD